MNDYNRKDDRKFIRRNEQIRCPRVLLVKDGRKLGIFPSFEANRMARDEGLDLVEVAPDANPPVCSIMDYGKYKFDQQRKDKEQRNLAPKEKEVTFRYVISDHDLEVKVNQAKRILEAGDKVRFVVKFKARENAHKEQGMRAIKKCLELLGESACIEKQPSFEGSQIICKVSLKNEKSKS